MAFQGLFSDSLECVFLYLNIYFNQLLQVIHRLDLNPAILKVLYPLGYACLDDLPVLPLLSRIPSMTASSCCISKSLFSGVPIVVPSAFRYDGMRDSGGVDKCRARRAAISAGGYPGLWGGRYSVLLLICLNIRKTAKLDVYI